MCEEGIAETAGRPDGDGIIGMSRLYFYEAVKLVLEGIQHGICRGMKPTFGFN
ncbi:MAG: hypothetical protein ACLRXQ_04390 [Phascolarctobacterium faecium]